jgi:hypothetical protein
MVVSGSGKGPLNQALKAFESAMAVDDPVAIYALMNSDIRSASSVGEFGLSWRDQEARIGRISALARGAVGDIQTDNAGVTFVIVTYTATVTAPSGSTSAQVFDARFVRQADGWKLWYTSPH